MGDRGVGVGDDMGEGMQCSDHPYRSNPGGICAFCLQEKLGKLVSSSKSNPFFPIPPPPSSSSSSPSFRSDAGAGGVGRMGGPSSGAAARRTKLLFLSAGSNKKKKKTGGSVSSSTSGGGRKISTATAAVSSSLPRPSDSLNIRHGSSSNAVVLKRSKSVAPRPAGGLTVDSGIMEAVDSPRKKSFWSFLSLTSSSSSSSSGNKVRSSSSSGEGVGGATDGGARHPGQQQKEGNARLPDVSSRIQAADNNAAAAAVVLAREEAKATQRRDNPAVGAGAGVGVAGEEAEESPNGSQASSSFGRKVARSRSVGCGSRSFSGDFLERISTGFGDCTLRRVESQREAKPKTMLHHHHRGGGDEQHGIKERVRCGGIFGGFGMIYSSSYWLSATASADADDDLDGGSSSSSRMGARGGSTPRGRSRSWSWAFASPMRAFRPSSSKPYAIAAGHKAAPTHAISTINSAVNSSVGGGDASTNNRSISSDGIGGDRVGDAPAPSMLVVRG